VTPVSTWGAKPSQISAERSPVSTLFTHIKQTRRGWTERGPGSRSHVIGNAISSSKAGWARFPCPTYERRRITPSNAGTYRSSHANRLGPALDFNAHCGRTNPVASCARTIRLVSRRAQQFRVTPRPSSCKRARQRPRRFAPRQTIARSHRQNALKAPPHRDRPPIGHEAVVSYRL